VTLSDPSFFCVGNSIYFSKKFKKKVEQQLRELRPVSRTTKGRVFLLLVEIIILLNFIDLKALILKQKK
jgi:hypothetical protein